MMFDARSRLNKAVKKQQWNCVYPDTYMRYLNQFLNEVDQPAPSPAPKQASKKRKSKAKFPDDDGDERKKIKTEQGAFPFVKPLPPVTPDDGSKWTTEKNEKEQCYDLGRAVANRLTHPDDFEMGFRDAIKIFEYDEMENFKLRLNNLVAVFNDWEYTT
jgi:hypothetical protein